MPTKAELQARVTELESAVAERDAVLIEVKAKTAIMAVKITELESPDLIPLILGAGLIGVNEETARSWAARRFIEARQDQSRRWSVRLSSLREFALGAQRKFPQTRQPHRPAAALILPRFDKAARGPRPRGFLVDPDQARTKYQRNQIW